MRQVLVDYARTQGALKRGPALQVELPENLASSAPAGSLLELDQALERLGQEDPRLVGLIEMRFFAGMTAEEAAEATAESVHVVRHDLRYAQTRLRRLMMGGAGRRAGASKSEP
jgi:DNA-directed RNA polymerase specialized sigma24 family protein